MTVPSLSRARPFSPPAATATTPLRPLTSTGLVLQALFFSLPHCSGPVVVPSPSSPSRLSPQARTWPLSSSASACWLPPERAVTPLSSPTATGVVLQASVKGPQVSGPVLVPPPNWP